MAEETKEEVVEVTQVPTGSALAFKFGEKVMNFEELMVELANDIKKIKRSVA